MRQSSGEDGEGSQKKILFGDGFCSSPRDRRRFLMA